MKTKCYYSPSIETLAVQPDFLLATSTSASLGQYEFEDLTTE